MKYMRKLHPYLDILVSNIGEVFVPATNGHPAHWTFGTKMSNGYRQVMIAQKYYKIHRLVAEAFIGPIPQGYQIDHANRVRDDNRLENIRICTPIENRRNRADHDRVEAQGRMHSYEDKKQYYCEQKAYYRAEHPEKEREASARYNQAKCKTHRRVNFSDGSQHWVPLTEAEAYLIIPLKERFYHAK